MACSLPCLSHNRFNTLHDYGGHQHECGTEDIWEKSGFFGRSATGSGVMNTCTSASFRNDG